MTEGDRLVQVAPSDPAAADGTALHLAANGGWQAGATADAGVWTGRIGELRAAPRRAGATPWAMARDIALRMRLSEAVVSARKQISKNLFVGYKRGLNAATGAWQLVYRIARQFTLRAKSGDESSIDAVYTWRWNGRKPTRRVP